MNDKFPLSLVSFVKIATFIGHLERTISMIRIDNACIKYNDKTLFKGLSLHVAKGETVCISGESGSGKTSLLRALLGFVPLAEGTIELDGITLNAQTTEKIRRRVTYIPQELSFPTEWVKEMVTLPFELKANHSSVFSIERLFENFRLLGLKEELYEKRVGEISGGQKQRIMLAVSGLLDKPVFVADEPTSALDAESVHKVLAFFRHRAQNGQTLIMVSHDKELSAGCDRIFTLH